MRTATRKAFNQYMERQAELNGVDLDVVAGGKKFVADASVEQTLETRIQESADFLKLINVEGVRDITGERIGMFAASTIAGRTDTSANDRPTQDPTDENPYPYFCEKTDFDTHVGYDKMDKWAKFPDFQVRMRNIITQQIARDRLMIGFNGIEAAPNTDRVANPLLQDVNVGWLEEMRTLAPERTLSEGATPGEVRIGPAAEGGDYENIDSLVMDVISNMIDPWHRQSTEMRSICGDQVLDTKYFQMVQAIGEVPTEVNALRNLIANKTVGNKVAIQVPFFPSRSIFITDPKNLSIYWQEGSRRRTINDHAARDRVEDFQSVNEDYPIEDLGAAALIENIVFWNGTAWG